MWDSKTVVGCCKLVCVLLYSTSTCYEEGLVNFLVDPNRNMKQNELQ